jgi:hypothetical protein
MGVFLLSLYGRHSSLCGHSRDEIQKRHSLSVPLHPHDFEWRLPSSCTVNFDSSMRAGEIDNAWFENVAAGSAATMLWLSIKALLSNGTWAMYVGCPESVRTLKIARHCVDLTGSGKCYSLVMSLTNCVAKTALLYFA